MSEQEEIAAPGQGFVPLEGDEAKVTDAVETRMPKETFSVGRVLRAARERSGESTADIARRFKLRIAQVEAVEADDWEKLPGRTFARGMVRSYAKAMGLNPESLVGFVLPEENDTSPNGIIPPSTPAMRAEQSGQKSGKRDLLVVILGILILLGAVLAYFFWPENNLSDRVLVSGPTESTAPPLAPIPASGEQAGPSPTPAPQTPEAPVTSTVAEDDAANKAAPLASLKIIFVENSWVEVKDKLGNIVLSTTGRAGSETEVNGDTPLSLHIGNAAGVKIQYKGGLVDLKPYTAGNVSRISLD